MPSTSTSMSAHRCFTAWKVPMGRPNWTRSLAYWTVMANTTSAAPSISAHTAATDRSSTASAARSSPSLRAGRSSRVSQPRLRVRSMAGSEKGRSPSSGADKNSPRAPSASANTTTRSASGPSTTGSDRPVNRHVPSRSHRARTASARRDHATAPTASPVASRWAHPPTSVPPRSAARLQRARRPIAATSAPCTTTEPAKGTGAQWRPSCSHSTATSTMPSPRPPSSAERSTAGHPCSAMATHRSSSRWRSVAATSRTRVVVHAPSSRLAAAS